VRRDEVAMLAGLSVDYYTRLRKGNLCGVPDSVLGAIAGALQLEHYGVPLWLPRWAARLHPKTPCLLTAEFSLVSDDLR
jgi:hypothetical protein